MRQERKRHAAAGLSLDGAGNWTGQVQRDVTFFLLISLLLDLPTIGYKPDEPQERVLFLFPVDLSNAILASQQSQLFV
jgi:hypothetical protein